MKKSLGKVRERKWSADMSSTNFLEDENLTKFPKKRDTSKQLIENSINCDNIKISIVFNNDKENIFFAESPNLAMEKDSLEFNNLVIKSKGYQKSENTSKERKEVFYGSPAIWLKNIKRNSDQKTGESSREANLFSTRSISKMKLKNLRNKQAKFNLNKKVNESPSHFQIQKNSPVMLKLQIYQEKIPENANTVNNDNKKLSVWAKNQSFIQRNKSERTRNINNTNETSFNLQLGGNNNINQTHISNSTFKTLMNNNKLHLKNQEKKFSNINHNNHSKLLSTTDNRTEIDEIINTCSYLDFSEILLKKDNETPRVINNSLLKNKIRKIKSPPAERLEDLAIKDGLGETIYLNNNLRTSKTHPNSENSDSPESSKSNSDKTNNICNIGSKSNTNNTNSSGNLNSGSNINSNSGSNSNKGIQLIISKESISQSSSLFKTINEKIQLDPYLHKSFTGKIKWKAGEVIAEGTTSIVYKALNEEEGNIFVVKRYKGINDPKMLETFQNEVKIFQQLDHPNIIKYIESEIIDKDLFIYLEYISGGSIKYIVDKYGPLKENLIKIYLKQIIEGLIYLHKKKIVHRDVKSANILLDCKGNIKLSDFGCSGQYKDTKIVPVNNSEEFLDSIKGTLPWMAPEVVCQQKYGKKADVWSLGCTLLEMASGQAPWGKLDNFYQAMNKIGRSEDTPAIPSNLSDNFKDFLSLCFKRNPKERPNVLALKEHPFLK